MTDIRTKSTYSYSPQMYLHVKDFGTFFCVYIHNISWTYIIFRNKTLSVCL